MGGLKSTQEKMERQQKCENQVVYWESKKESLKDMKCDSVEDVAKKLEMFHAYEDQIAAAKEEYNNSQMWHMLDEAREQGEKIAEAAEKLEPKTAEERQKEMAEEAMGTEDSKGALTEALEESTEIMEELTEEMTEELTEKELTQTAEEQSEMARKLTEEEKYYRNIDIRI
ncbi:MAG: hypothetical protein J1F02_01305 [Lachnospiraceae bacterium]|nr:hypothetical protein [Lachnospiraceae bacterium]